MRLKVERYDSLLANKTSGLGWRDRWRILHRGHSPEEPPPVPLVVMVTSELPSNHVLQGPLPTKKSAPGDLRDGDRMYM